MGLTPKCLNKVNIMNFSPLQARYAASSAVAWTMHEAADSGPAPSSRIGWRAKEGIDTTRCPLSAATRHLVTTRHAVHVTNRAAVRRAVRRVLLR